MVTSARNLSTLTRLAPLHSASKEHNEVVDLPSKLAAKLEGGAARAARVLDRRPLLAWCAFTLVFFTTSALRASRKPLWFDELATVFVCRLPSMSDVWSAFLGAADAMPPLLHLLTRTSVAVFGEGHISWRLPAMVGVWTMCLCLYLFVRRHCPAVYAWVAAVMMAVTVALMRYSEEARSYGLLLGFSGIALVSWQSAIGRSRRWAIVGLVLSLAAAVSCHYAATMVIAVLGLAEAARSWDRRRIDWAVFGALTAGATPILLLLPAMVVSTAVYQGDLWSTPRLGAIPSSYSSYFARALTPLCVVFLLSCAYWVMRQWSSADSGESESWRMPRYEAAAAIAFQILPVITVLTAFMAGTYVARYALPAVAGFCVMTAYLLRTIERGRRVLPLLFLVVFLSYLTVDAGQMSRIPLPLAGQNWIEATRENADLPIVIDDAQMYLQQVYYAPVDIVSRLRFLTDSDRARQDSTGNSGTVGIMKLAPWAPLQVEQPGPFLEERRRFYLCGKTWRGSWLRNRLVRTGANLRLVHRGRSGTVYLVESDGQLNDAQ
jgi:dolichyl-phosphate-mannose-protein mannosyltransferase